MDSPSPRLEERANQRGEAIQKEIDALKRDLADLRIPWERLQASLKARQEALEQGIVRQKAEVLRTVIDRIVCRFSRSGERCTLQSIDIYAAKEGAVRPLSFPVDSLQMDSHLGAFA